MRSTRLKVVKVIFSNIDLDILSQDLRVKLGETIKEYKALQLPKFQRKKKFYESCENLKILAQI